MEDKKPALKRPDVLKKLNAESLYMIERGLLGDLPDKLKPQPFIPRGRPTDLQVAKPTGFLSSCLPVIPDSPSSSEKLTSDEESISPLKKTFSFRDRFSRISFFGKDKERPKWKTETIEEAEDKRDLKTYKEIDYKSQKRFWFFRNKEMSHKSHSPIYQRSKSFEFLPRALEEEEKKAGKLFKRQSSVIESDSMGDAWTSNDSLEYISNVYYDKEDGVFLKSIREFPSESSTSHSNMSTVSASSNTENIFKRESVQNLLDEFDKAVDMFSETYLSDCEPYTRSKSLSVRDKRKSASFSSMPSPKVLQPAKVEVLSEDFRKELTKAIAAKVRSRYSGRKPRRGSVTDWFVLEDQNSEVGEVRSEVKSSEVNKYRRGQKKAVNRVRRISSTKYVSNMTK